jgi:hypothetical protein
MGIGVSARSASDGLQWYELNPQRLELERLALTNPWRFVQADDGRYKWEGGTLRRTWRGKATTERSVRLIYPYGYPARFIEARIVPEPPSESRAAFDAHINIDGSACYVTADGWSPQDTVKDALRLLCDWWWNYYWLVERELPKPWPSRGLIEV